MDLAATGYCLVVSSGIEDHLYRAGALITCEAACSATPFPICAGAVLFRGSAFANYAAVACDYTTADPLRCCCSTD